MTRFAAGLALAVSVLASPAMAQKGTTASFSIGSVDYSVSIPKGYCLPESDKDKERAEAVAAYDDQNLSVLSVMSCGENAHALDSFVIKAPREMVNQPSKRSDILESPDFAKSDVLAPFDEGQMGQIVKRETGLDVAVDATIKVLGHDELCGYIGGTVSLAVGEKHYVTVAGCMTVIGDRMLMVVFSAPGNDPADISRLRGKARAVAVTIRAKK